MAVHSIQPDIARPAETILDRPVMVIGCPRSGTTWLRSMMLCHPLICGARESQFFVYFSPVLDKYWWDLEHRPQRSGLPVFVTEERLVEMIRDFWREVMRPILSIKPGAGVLLEKSPTHALFVRRIHRILPEARFILMVRDSRAVSASLLAAGRDGWASHWAPTTARGAARMWRRHNHAALVDLEKLPSDQWTLCRYEHLIRDTPGVLRQLFSFAGVSANDAQIETWVSQCVKHANTTTDQPISTTERSIWDIANTPQPIGFVRPGGPDKWRHELNWFQKQLIWLKTRKLMKKLGYGRAGNYESHRA